MRPNRLSFGIFLLAVSALSASAQQRPGGFRVIGPGGGGAMYHPTISPYDAQTVLVNCDMTGAYITHDGGANWRMFSLRGAIDGGFSFDPKDKHTIYALGTGLWRSTDDGVKWKLVYPRPQDVRGVQMNSDHADEEILTGPDSGGQIAAFAVDAHDGKTLYAAVGEKIAAKNRTPDTKTNGSLLVTHDGGANWQTLSKLAGPVKWMWSSPSGDTIVTAGTHGFTTWKDGKLQTISLGDKDARLTDATVDFHGTNGLLLYAVVKNALRISTDMGATWTTAKLPGDGREITTMATADDGHTVYASFHREWLKGVSAQGSVAQGIAKSEDGGKTWKIIWGDGQENIAGSHGAPNFADNWLSDSHGSAWGGEPLSIRVATQDKNLIYATDLGRTMKSTDGGLHWTALYSKQQADGGWTSTGLDVLTGYGIHFDPFNAKRVFLTYTDVGLFRSENGGESWISSIKGVPRSWRNTTYWIVFDPEVPGRMWSVNSGTHDLPRPKMWRTRSTDTYHGGVSRSDDGGRTWHASNQGMPETAPTHMLMDPHGSKGHRILYVATMGHGVYKSTDDGATWSAKNKGITQDRPMAFRLSQAKDGTLYVVIARRSEDGNIGNAGDGALYRSTNGAETWQPMALPTGVNGPNGLAIDPENPQRMYLAAWARAKGVHGEGGGIYGTVDGGATWKPLFTEDQHIYDVTIDPKSSKTLYATGFESSAWSSQDSGAHWSRISGYNFKYGHRVFVDPQHDGEIYIMTFGGGVWHGSVHGKATPLDIDTPVMEPGQNTTN